MSPHASDDGFSRGLRPGPPLRGGFDPPGSKSLAQRALVLAGLAEGETRITRLPTGADAASDVRAARGALETCGVRIEQLAPAAVRVRGSPPGPHRGWRASEPVELGESGTLARLATAVVALCGTGSRSFELTASGSLLARSSPPLFACLRASGVELICSGTPEGWPVRVASLGPPSRLALDEPVSSQEVSALLCALCAWPDSIELTVSGPIPSRPYLDMTIAMLARFGASIAQRAHGSACIFDVRGPLRAPSEPFAIEPDASAAAVALAAACLSGGELLVPGLAKDSLQGDVRIVEHLRSFGCRADFSADGIRAGGEPDRGATIDLSGEPDLAPVLAAVAAGVALRARVPPDSAASLLTGLATLQRKESARIRVLADGLHRAGLSVEDGADFLRIAPGEQRRFAPIELDPAGDHRMVFAFALLGLVRGGVLVRDPDCVAKSWPSFWSDLERLGARAMLRE